jgi:hypothetical protein
LGVISTASLVVGQLIKMRDRFGEVDAETGKFNGKLTTTGKLIAGASAAAGIAALLYADYTATKSKAEATTREFAEALKAEGDAQKTALAKLIEGKPGYVAALEVVTKLGINFADLSDKTSASAKRLNEVADAFDNASKDDLNIRLGELNKLLGDGANLTRDQAFQVRQFVKELQNGTLSLEDQATAAIKANEALNANADATNRAADANRSLTSIFEQNYKWAEMRNRQVDRGAALAEYATLLDERLAKQQEESDKKATEAKTKFAEKVETLAEKLRTKLATALKTAEDNAAAANKAYADYQKSISGSVSGVVNLGNAQATAAENTKKLADARTEEGRAQGKLNELLGKQVDIDDKVAAAREKLIAAQQRPDSDKEKADAIKDAERELNGLLEDQTGIVKQVTDARTDLATATNAVLTAEKQPLTFADALAGQVTKAEGFKTNLQKVLDLGGDQALIDQLTSAGADAGNSIITGILASSDPAQTVDDLDKTLANVAAFASAIGTISADKFFGAGVKLADDLLRGVTEELAKIDVDKLAESKNPLKALKRASNKFDSSLGFLFSENALTIPSLADGGIVPARPGGTLVRVGEAGQDEMVLPLPRQQSGSNITINVTAGMGADGTQIGRQIVDELVAYQRRVGALPIKVSG